MSRQTGKTFRKLMESLKLASEGNHIIYICDNEKMSYYMFGKATGVVSMFMKTDFDTKEQSINIGEGSIKFVSDLMSDKDLYLKGKQYTIVWDIL